MRLLIAAFALGLLAGCATPRSSEEIAESVVDELAGRVRPLDASIPPPESPLPTNSPPTVDREVVLRRSAEITELEVRDMEIGAGPLVEDGAEVVINYVGMLPDGYVFDSSYQQNRQPFSFRFGPHAQVIEGWREGLKGMRVGGVRVIRIPANMAYGDQPPPGSGIPPGAALIFHLELMWVSRPVI